MTPGQLAGKLAPIAGAGRVSGHASALVFARESARVHPRGGGVPG